MEGDTNMSSEIRCTRFLLATVLALGAFGVSAPVALALPPSNDTFAGATPVAVGFTEVLATTEATTDADDAQLNASCGMPATDASVWYALTTASDIEVVVDVSQSSYAAGILVGVGSQGNLQTVACGPSTVAFFATAGTTYYVLAIDDQYDGGGNGGLLSISFTVPPPTPTLDITVNRFGQVNARTGIATISGTYTCMNGDDFLAVVGTRQNVGRFSIVGWGNLFECGTCDGAPHAWAADVFPEGPLWANVFLPDVDRMLERAQVVTKQGEYEVLRYARFADDLVVLTSHHPRAAHWGPKVEKRLREEIGKLGLTVNEEKTRIVNVAAGKPFDFLGYTFRWVDQWGRPGKKMVLCRPQRKKRTRLLRNLGEKLRGSLSFDRAARARGSVDGNL